MSFILAIAFVLSTLSTVVIFKLIQEVEQLRIRVEILEDNAKAER